MMAVLVMISTFGAVNGIILAGPRVYYAMAEDGLLFRWLGAVHPRFQTPHRALVLQGALASLLALTDSYRALFTRVVYTEWIFFALMAAGLFRLRRRADYRPAYRIWGYPVVPGLFVAGVGRHRRRADLLRAAGQRDRVGNRPAGSTCLFSVVAAEGRAECR